MVAETIQILLVDDNPDDIVMIQESFQDLQLINFLHVAENGEQALSFLRREDPYADADRPSLILLDINMPRKNGFEVLEDIKRDANLRDIPVIMLTTSDREEDVVRSYQNGASSYISKPLSLDRFQEIARQLTHYWSRVSCIPGNFLAT